MQTVTRATPYPSRPACCCGLGAALPMVDASVLAQAPAAQEAAGALVHDYRGREMRPVLETRGIQSASGFKLATSAIPTESSSNSSLHEE
jgi:hypothetical protein